MQHFNHLIEGVVLERVWPFLKGGHDFAEDGFLTRAELSSNGLDKQKFKVGLINIIHFEEELIFMNLV